MALSRHGLNSLSTSIKRDCITTSNRNSALVRGATATMACVHYTAYIVIEGTEMLGLSMKVNI